MTARRRLLVVGASSGIGRAVAAAAADDGWRVAAAARRADRLEELAASRKRITAVPADVRNAHACRWLVEAAVVALDGLDAIVYAAGVVPLRPLTAVDAPTWKSVLDTNLVGASLVTAAAIPHLSERGGHAIYLSSDSVGRPLPGLVPYAASKAGLEETVRGWRAEHPEVKFTTLVVGPTVTGMADGWDQAEMQSAFDRWARDGYAQGRPDPQSPEVVAKSVVELLDDPDPPATARAVPGED
ncbi:MAG TPA: SDR family oxidoreductase [Acidimicrobiia bacterium]|nr:SDR family oxidoreductase [Acidimicrobiia bacterium]